MSEICDWIDSALASQPVFDVIEFEGASIRYGAWGSPGERDIMLVHGGAAHSHWWDHIAPHLATKGRVVALDLSGHGDSDHRTEYSVDQWGAEVLAASAAAGLSDPTIVGHSLGGLITMDLLCAPGSGVSQAIVIDSPVGGTNAEKLPEAAELVARRPRLYSSAEEALARFRPVPDQRSHPVIVDHIARHSIREMSGGWTWKFDGRIFDGRAEILTDLPSMDGRLAFFRAEVGLVSTDARATIEGAGGMYIEIPGAGHAPMLDQPIALVTGIRAVLAAWDQLP